MKGQGRIECEIDDLMRLYVSKQSDILKIVREEVTETTMDLKRNLKGKWNDDLGTGMEIMESMLLGYLAKSMEEYVSGEVAAEKKHHDEDCALRGII